MEKILKPIVETSSDYEELVEILSDYFKKEIYLPLVKIIGESDETVLNSSDSKLSRDIKKGIIKFYRGRFIGKFSAATTKELKDLGATWDRSDKSFKITQSKLPARIKRDIQTSEIRFQKKMQRIDKALAEAMGAKFSKTSVVSKFFDQTLFRIDETVKKTVGDFGVVPTIT